MDPLSLSTFRSSFSLIFMIGWLWLQPPPVPYTPRQRWIALGVGVLFAGIVFGLFKAIQLVDVPIAILTYFIYPLLTGIIGALIGIDKLGWRGATAAVVAFLRPCADRRRAPRRDCACRPRFRASAPRACARRCC